MEICNKCLCNKCVNNYVESFFNNVLDTACFNCDECYYYGMDDDTLSKNVKFECNNFRIANCYAESKRNKLKLIK
ncbi:hypothetical protein [Clostridium sp. HBUAS56017]|uniref:hypothetical protein n=1 Tax=Clostridium sp. HBUAS56017 TaxID=2571128 RepID=UPI001FA9DA5D|nr:hypothetical protein [Clostridium sp. HBUAS56017]